MIRPLAKVRPGQAARRLLGGDDAVHVFEKRSRALDYTLRIPGALTLAPNPMRKYGGWIGLLAECKELSPRKIVFDRRCVIEVDEEPDPATKRVIRELGAVFYQAGATEVRCLGRLIARPPQQRSLW